MADSDQITGSIQIDITQAQEALGRIAASLEATKASMQTGFTGMQSQSAASSQAIKNDVEKMSTGIIGSVKDMSGQVTGAFSSLSASLGKIGTVFIGLGAIFAGGALFKSVVDKFVDMNLQAKQLGTVMGITSQDAAAMIVAFERVGISGEGLISMENRMARMLKQNEAQFNANGVATRDANNDMLSMTQITANVIQRMGEMRVGYDQVALSQMAFGRGQADISKLLRIDVVAAVAAAKEHLASLGLTFDDVSTEKAFKFKAGIHDVELVFDAMKYKLGEELIPVLINLGNWFASNGPGMIRVFVNAIHSISAAFTETKLLWDETVNGFVWGFEFLRTLASGFYQAMSLMVRGHFTEADRIWSEHWADALTIVRKAGDELERMRVIAHWKVEITTGKPGGGYGGEESGYGGGAGAEETPPTGGESFVPKPTGGKGGAPGLLEQYKAELEQIKTEENTFFEFSKERERQFWQDKLETVKAGSKEYLAIQHEIFALSKAIDKEAADAHLADLHSQISSEKTNWDQKRSLMDQAVGYAASKYGTDSKTYQGELDKKRALDVAYTKYQTDLAAKQIDDKAKLALMDLARQEETVKFEEKMGQISASNALEQLRILKEQELAIEESAITQKQAIYKDDEKMQEKLASDLAAFKQKKLTDETKAVQTAAQQQKAQIQSFLAPMESAIQGSVMGIIQGTTTMQKAIQNLCTSIVSAFVGTFAKILETWIANQLQMLIYGKTSQSATAAAQITAESGIVYLENVAGLIPTVGPLAAAGAAGALTGGEVGTAMAMTALDTGAWNIPRAGAAMLHPGEAVLPASKAAGLDQLIDGGGAGGGDTHFHLNITAFDGADVQRVLLDNPAALAAALKALGRNFVPVF